MVLRVPAYQAAGAAKICFEEAELASVDLGNTMQRGLETGAAMQDLYYRMTDTTRVEVAQLVRKELDHTGHRLEVHVATLRRIEDFFVKASSIADSQDRMIDLPEDIADLIMGYMDEAFANFVDCLFETNGENIARKGLSRDEVISMIPRYNPEVDVSRLWCNAVSARRF